MEFGRSVNPIQTRGQIVPLTLLPALPGFKKAINTSSECAPWMSFPPNFHTSIAKGHQRSSGANFGHRDEFRLFAKETDKYIFSAVDSFSNPEVFAVIAKLR